MFLQHLRENNLPLDYGWANKSNNNHYNLKHTSNECLCIQCQVGEWNVSFTATLATRTFRSLPPWRVLLKDTSNPETSCSLKPISRAQQSHCSILNQSRSIISISNPFRRHTYVGEEEGLHFSSNRKCPPWHAVTPRHREWRRNRQFYCSKIKQSQVTRKATKIRKRFNSKLCHGQIEKKASMSARKTHCPREMHFLGLVTEYLLSKLQHKKKEKKNRQKYDQPIGLGHPSRWRLADAFLCSYWLSIRMPVKHWLLFRATGRACEENKSWKFNGVLLWHIFN